MALLIPHTHSLPPASPDLSLTLIYFLHIYFSLKEKRNHQNNKQQQTTWRLSKVFSLTSTHLSQVWSVVQKQRGFVFFSDFIRILSYFHWNFTFSVFMWIIDGLSFYLFNASIDCVINMHQAGREEWFFWIMIEIVW